MSTYLPIDLVGSGQDALRSAVGQTLKSINWPESQSFECAWRLEIVWGNGKAWIVQSVSTMTESGHEIGSLRIEELSESSLDEDFRRASLSFDEFTLASCRIASASEFGVTSDCAIALIDDACRELVIATAPAPGAVVLVQPGQSYPKTEFVPSTFVWRLARH